MYVFVMVLKANIIQYFLLPCLHSIFYETSLVTKSSHIKYVYRKTFIIFLTYLLTIPTNNSVQEQQKHN